MKNRKLIAYLMMTPLAMCLLMFVIFVAIKVPLLFASVAILFLFFGGLIILLEEIVWKDAKRD